LYKIIRLFKLKFYTMRHHLIFLICTMQLAQSLGYPVGIPALATESIVALHPSSFIAAPVARWVNVNNTQFYPILGSAPVAIHNDNGEPLSIRFNGSVCLGNDLNSNGSIPAATELTLFVVFTAPPLGTHTLFAQQSSPTEGYAVTISRDQENIVFALYIDGNQYQGVSRPATSFPVGTRVLANVKFQQNYLGLLILGGGMAGGFSVPTPTFSVAARETLVGCNIDGTNLASLDIHELIVLPRMLNTVEERLVYVILIARHGFTFSYDPTFDNEEFNTDVTGIYYLSNSGLAFGGACRSAELVLYTNTTDGWPTSYWLVGHTNQTSLDMVPFQGNFSRSSRVWYVASGNSNARLSIAFDEKVFLRPEIDWSKDSDMKHLLLYSATREYNWTVLATINATNARSANFDGLAMNSGYITYGVTAPITPPSEPITVQPVSAPQESLPPVISPVDPVAVPIEAIMSVGSMALRSTLLGIYAVLVLSCL
jgi:hypothetical protein